MATSITNTSSTASVTTPSPNPSLQQMKTQLTAALQSIAGKTGNAQLKELLKDAEVTDAAPRGFPAGVGWADAFRMVARRTEDNNPSTPGNLVLSEDILNRNLLA
ncbi:MAG: hypothetical protein ACKO10_02690, partial [Betaproteobacteria bacterium]